MKIYRINAKKPIVQISLPFKTAMAQQFANALRETTVPTLIFGWGEYSNVEFESP